MKRATIFCLILIAVLLSASVASAKLLDELDEAIVNANWQRAENVLDRLTEKYGTKTPATLDQINIMKAWVAIRNGDNSIANNIAIHDPSAKSDHFWASLNDVKHAALLVDIDAIPDLVERVVVGAADHGYHMDLEVRGDDYIKAINKVVKAKIEEYTQVKDITTSFVVPVPQKLLQDEFESSTEFAERVAIEEQRYKESIIALQRSYNARVQVKQHKLAVKIKRVPEVRRFYTQWALNVALGVPTIERVTYDADKEIFLATVKTSKQNLSYKIAIPVPRKMARQSKEALVNGKPLLVYRLNDKGLQLTHVLLESSTSQLYNTHLSSDSLELKQLTHQVASVDIDDMLAKVASNVSNLPQITPGASAINFLKSGYRGSHTTKQAEYQYDDLQEMLTKQKTAQPNDNKFALIIGIEKYSFAHTVPYAKKSADTFKKVAEKILGVPSENIYLLTNHSATAGRISIKIKEIVSRVTRGGTLYFYYAGHGIPNQSQTGTPYLLASDIEPASAHLMGSMAVGKIFEQLKSGNKGRVVAFIDSCFSGNSDNKPLLQGIAPGLKFRKDADIPAKKFLVYTAGTSHQFANYYKTKGHRLFSYYLLKGLLEGKGKSAKNLQNYLLGHVSKRSAIMGSAYRQTPEMRGDITKGIL